MQPEQQASGFFRFRIMPEILLAKILIAEFIFSGNFPQEVQIDFFRYLRSFRNQFCGLMRTELEQYILCTNLCSLASGQFNLKGLADLIQDTTRFKFTGFFKK